MSRGTQMVWMGPAHDTASLRHLKRALESQTQVWFRQRRADSVVTDVSVYTTAPGQTRTTEEGVLLAVDLVNLRGPPRRSAFEQEVYTRKMIYLTRGGADHGFVPTGQLYAFSIFRDDDVVSATTAPLTMATRFTRMQSSMPKSTSRGQIGATKTEGVRFGRT